MRAVLRGPTSRWPFEFVVRTVRGMESAFSSWSPVPVFGWMFGRHGLGWGSRVAGFVVAEGAVCEDLPGVLVVSDAVWGGGFQHENTL